MRYVWGCVFAFLVSSCGLKEAQAEKSLGLPNFLISDFKYVAINTMGQKEWELKASEAVMYQNSDDVFIYNFRVAFYRISNGVEILDSILTANKGQVNKKSLLVIAEGNVRILASETSLETERIQWDNIKKLFFSEAGIPVVIQRGGTRLIGYNLVADASLKEIRMENIDAKIQQ
ncbi:LPS export ABC transporter periplasmic protein LptC [Thermospira aquatica]|uniref:LPS export ABC transporter periplasmic protein LptC n=1 Tax=Thermospira aquatica TaxID=2828656 RepID=A0AAX3BBX8_9SPIR|nr:LPS export ABC transporter periplasmic protein LptC [Thermospira aquatica]URA09801.1 LPS export ABC transporter periplasmic protein LptC [Thermospira aquatica]